MREGQGIRFSVVIILYNQLEYIAECINSVLNQTYPVYEIIVVDDGSTDGSSAYVRQVSKEHSDIIKVITQENSGAFVARATGMKHVTGDYFIVIDSDDAMRKDTLEIVASEIQKKNPDMVLINYSRYSSFLPKDMDYAEIGMITDSDSFVDIRVYRRVLAKTSINQVWDKFYKAELIAKVNVDEYGAGIIWGEDRIHTLMFADVVETILLIDEPLYYYRENPNSRCNTYDFRKLESGVSVCKVSRIFADRWFESKEALRISEQYDLRLLICCYMEPFVKCGNWSNTKKTLRKCLSNEYGYNVLHREVGKESLPVERRLLEALVDKNYRLLHVYFIKFYLNRSIVRILPASTVKWVGLMKKKIKKLLA